MAEKVLEVKNLSKKFTRSIKRSMLYGTMDIARSMLGVSYETNQLRKGEFWALKDINFELEKGQTLGVIGVNGSGKSTLLRMLTGIFPPDTGSIKVKGRVGSLIAVGAGFHPHMTGRENIFLNGTILGMSRNQIEQKFNDIVNFADIGEFIDAPVSTYSSGMRVRLGFAIAIQSDPDILLVDEILSVGDLSFRNKSLRHMAEFRKKANAVIFVSHDIEQVRNLCDRVIILDDGKIIYDGPTHEGIVKYEEQTRVDSLKSIGSVEDTKLFRNFQSDMESIKVEELGIKNEGGEKVDSLSINEGLTFYCRFSLTRSIESLFFTFAAVSSTNYDNIIHLVSNDYKNFETNELHPGVYEIQARVKDHHLVPNLYLMNFALRNSKTGETYLRILSNIGFRIKSDGKVLQRGIVNVENSWELLNLR